MQAVSGYQLSVHNEKIYISKIFQILEILVRKELSDLYFSMCIYVHVHWADHIKNNPKRGRNSAHLNPVLETCITISLYWTLWSVITCPVVLWDLPCTVDTVRSMSPGPPQSHADTASGGPRWTNKYIKTNSQGLLLVILTPEWW